MATQRTKSISSKVTEVEYDAIVSRADPQIVRIGRRVLVRQDALLDWLGQKSQPSLER